MSSATNALRKLLPDASHASLQKLLRAGSVMVDSGDGSMKRLRRHDRVPDVNHVVVPNWARDRWQGPSVQSFDDLNVVGESEDALAVDKPAGMCVQSGVKQATAHWTLAQLASQRDLQLVHRLDAATSGVVVLAKTRRGLDTLLSQFRHRHVSKEYLALLEHAPGNHRQAGVITAPVDGKAAVTQYELLAYCKTNNSHANRPVLVRLKPSTGRMHQLRKHAAEQLHAPVVNDARYGAHVMTKHRRKICLHAHKVHAPGVLVAEAPMPLHMQRIMHKHGL